MSISLCGHAVPSADLTSLTSPTQYNVGSFNRTCVREFATIIRNIEIGYFYNRCELQRML